MARQRSAKPLFTGSNPVAASSKIKALGDQITTPSLLADTQRLIPDYLPFVLMVLVLGFMIRFIRSRRRPGSPRKLYQLSDQEIALVGLASDTLSDLWRRLQAKRRSNVIHLPG